MKTCSVCTQKKSLAEFHKDRRNLDGRGRICKMCWKAKYTARQEAKRMTPEGRKHLAKLRRERETSELKRARERRHATKRRFVYPEKAWAHRAIKSAIVRGELIRPIACQRCGGIPPTRRDGASMIHAHHQDYSKLLDIRWLCIFCHTAEHNALKDRKP